MPTKDLRGLTLTSAPITHRVLTLDGSRGLDGPSVRDDYLLLFRESGVGDPTTEDARIVGERLGFDYERLDNALQRGIAAGYFRLRD